MHENANGVKALLTSRRYSGKRGCRRGFRRHGALSTDEGTSKNVPARYIHACLSPVLGTEFLKQAMVGSWAIASMLPVMTDLFAYSVTKHKESILLCP
jgi:hypothetical protein